jgi:hypothetical protein
MNKKNQAKKFDQKRKRKRKIGEWPQGYSYALS